ncbi:hypothetical protein EG244_14960 [Falsigemmobacter faecalis]|uniref:Transposase DDE domain-containing protein n=1 Tax=Falsigemmobacter faecalis TaxID=2488730 RepID=A0A3P3DIG3_9RHOB|nr:hypothetical protein EG244_14960 [Falsigemmobacter faecalis]
MRRIRKQFGYEQDKHLIRGMKCPAIGLPDERRSGLPLGQATGFMENLPEFSGFPWSVPDFSRLSRRQKTLNIVIPDCREESLHLLIATEPLRHHGSEPNGEGGGR